MTRILTLAALLAFVAFAPPATAGRYDVQLSQFATLSQGALTIDEAAYERLVFDLGVAFQPRFAGPGSTVGSLGFDIGYSIALTDINETGRQWTQAVDDPGGTLQVSQISLRKGLPYSVELGGVVSVLHDSDLYGVALEIKWALLEGFRSAPDIGIRAHVGSVLGSRDIALLMAGGDLIFSKSFGLGGLVQLIPYAGYSGGFIRASSHVIGTFPAGGLEPTTLILPDQNLGAHRGVLGVRVIPAIVDIGFEAALGKTQTYAFRMGLNF